MASKVSTKQPGQSRRSKTARDLNALVAEFDREFVADSFRELSPAQQEKWDHARRGRGRPKVGAGVRVISVSIEKELLRSADRLAKSQGVSRAKLISFGLRQLIEKHPTAARSRKK